MLRLFCRVLPIPVAVMAIAACGSRSALPWGTSTKASISPDIEGGTPDATVTCGDPPVCVSSDLAHVYQCGQPIVQCSLLEQCVNGACVNPCITSLGQNTSNGCEFYAVEMDVTPETQGACFAAFLVNQWSTGQAAHIEVDLNGTALPVTSYARIPRGTGTNITYEAFDPVQGLPQNEIVILFLSRDPAAANDLDPTSPRRLASCPTGVLPAVSGDAALHGTGVGKAFHIKTDVPVVAYQMLPYGAGRARVTGATLLFPTNVWNTNYVAVNAYAAPLPENSDGPLTGPTMVVIASQDQTTISLNPAVPVVSGGGLAGGGAGVALRYQINKGEYIQFTQPAELTGSPIVASAPVALIGGATLMDVPISVLRGDTAEQMIPPIDALGSEYVAVRYRSRNPSAEESAPWRVVAVVDNTQFAYDPAPPTGAPTSLNAGQSAEFESATPFVVSSQDANHPFYVAGYMTGGQNFNGAGDPEFVNVVPPQQYLARYTFFTDPTYPETNLVMVRALDPKSAQFPTVSIDCAGEIFGWAPVGTAGKYEFARFDLSTGNFVGQNGCNNGVHSIFAAIDSTTQPTDPLLSVTVWGWGSAATSGPDLPPYTDEADPNFTQWVSYAYPAGANLKSLNTVVFGTP